MICEDGYTVPKISNDMLVTRESLYSDESSSGGLRLSWSLPLCLWWGSRVRCCWFNLRSSMWQGIFVLSLCSHMRFESLGPYYLHPYTCCWYRFSFTSDFSMLKSIFHPCAFTFSFSYTSPLEYLSCSRYQHEFSTNAIVYDPISIWHCNLIM